MNNTKIIRDIQDVFRYHSLPVCRDIILGQAVDILPNAKGEYGYSVDNPIITCGYPATQFYLESLFSEESDLGVNYKRLKSTSSNVARFPVDLYQVECTNGTQKNELYFYFYSPITSQLAPKSYYLLQPSSD